MTNINKSDDKSASGRARNQMSAEEPTTQERSSDNFVIPHKNIGWHLFKNTAALAVGRIFNSLLRLIIAAMIVRGLGSDAFGEYSLVIALLSIADWLLDFGTTDVFVREVVKNPNKFSKIQRVMVALKLFQLPLAIAFLMILIWLMQFPSEIVIAGLIASASLTFFAGVTIYRSIFKATLTMEREMIAEFISILAMIPFIMLAVYFNTGIIGLTCAVLISRAVFFACCFMLGYKEHSLSIRGVEIKDVKWLSKTSYLIGIIGLLAVVNHSIEIILLSRFSELTDVAYFSAAQKLVWPVFMVLGAIGTAFYPVMASRWGESPEEFRKICQQALDITLLLGGMAVSGIFCGAEFLMEIVGQELITGSDALKILVIMCVIKSISAVVGPALFIVRAERHAFNYFSLALLVKVLLIVWLAPLYGYMGVAYISLAIEIFLIMPLTLYRLRRFTGFPFNFSLAFRVLVITLFSVILAEYMTESGSISSAILAVFIYAILAVVTGIAKIETLRTIINLKKGSQ